MNKSWILHILKKNNLTRNVSIYDLKRFFSETVEYASLKLHKQGIDIWEFLENEHVAQKLQNKWNGKEIKKEIRTFNGKRLIYFIHKDKDIALVVEE